MQLRLMTLMLAIVCSAGPSIKADESRAKPDTVQFDFEEKRDGQNRTCNLMTMIMDPSRPGVVNFRVIHALSPTALFLGFSLDVGDMRYQRGVPAGLNQIALAHGDVSTSDFNSEGSMYGGPIQAGGVFKSTMDGETAGRLWRGIVAGDFSLRFVRATAGAQPRTYVITKAPSSAPLGHFLACSAEITDIALGKSPDPDLYERMRRGGPGITEPMPTSRGTVIPPVSLQSPLVGKR
jgi:hypothetical protein